LLESSRRVVCHQAAAELEHNSQLQQPSLLSASWQTLATADAGWQQSMPAAAHPATAAQGNMHGARFNYALSGGAAAGKIALNAAVTQVRQRMAAVPGGGAAPASTGAVDECTVASEQLNPALSAQQHQQQQEPATATPGVCSMSSSSGGSSAISSNNLCGTAVALTACHGQNCVMAPPQQNQLSDAAPVGHRVKISWLQRLLLQQQGQLQKSQPRLPLKDLLLQPMALQPQQKPLNSTLQQQLQQQLVQQQLQQSEQQQLLPLEPQAQLLFQAPQQLAQQPQPLLPSQQQQVQAPQQLAQQQMPLLQSEEQQQVQAPHQLAQQPQPPLLSPKQQLPPQHLEQQEQQQQPQSEQPHLSIQDQEDIRLLIEALRRRTVCHRSLH
jgi:hypothetical protein